MVEGDWASLTGVRMSQTFCAASPGALELRHSENSSGRCSVQTRGLQPRQTTDLECYLDGHTNVFRCHPKSFATLDEPLVKPRDSVLNPSLDGEKLRGSCSLS